MLTIGEVQSAAGITCRGDSDHKEERKQIIVCGHECKRGGATYCKCRSRDDRSLEVGKQRLNQLGEPAPPRY